MDIEPKSTLQGCLLTAFQPFFSDQGKAINSQTVQGVSASILELHVLLYLPASTCSNVPEHRFDEKRAQSTHPQFALSGSFGIERKSTSAHARLWTTV